MDYDTLRDKYGKGPSGGPNANRRLLTFAIIVVLAISALLIYFFMWGENATPYTPSVINANPELTCQSSDWIVNLTGYGWSSNGYCSESVRGRNGVAVIHPIDTVEPRYLEQDVDLGMYKSVTLNLSIGNVGKDIGDTTNLPEDPCLDSLFRIKIIDLSTGEESQMDERAINYNDGWVSLNYDISGFAGTRIKIRIEDYSGGPCGLWMGEWGSVDYARVYA